MTGRPINSSLNSSLIDRLLRKHGVLYTDLCYKLELIMLKETLQNTDWAKWGRNTLIFAAPFLLVFLVALQGGSDLKDALNILYLFALNTVIDLVRKFIAANK